MPLRVQSDAGVPLVVTDPDDPASQAIRQTARGIIALSPVELPVLAMAAPSLPQAPRRRAGSPCRWRARATRLGVAAAVVDGELVAGDVAISGDRVTAVGLRPAGRGTAVPGFVDLQVNGYAGVDFLTGDDRRVARGRARAGVRRRHDVPADARSPRRATRCSPRSSVPRACAVSPASTWKGRSSHRCDSARTRRSIAAIPTWRCCASSSRRARSRMVTLAPELPGADELVDELTARGTVVSLGHSAASAEVATAAFARGARCVTHVFNAMGGVTAREPGLAGAALADPRVTVMCIADGVHLAEETLRLVATAARGRLVLTTDAIAPAGAIVARDGRATLPDGTLAGGLGTLAEAVRRLVSLGVPLVEAVDAASGAPARLLGREDIGTLRPGVRADVVDARRRARGSRACSSRVSRVRSSP